LVHNLQLVKNLLLVALIFCHVHTVLFDRRLQRLEHDRAQFLNCRGCLGNRKVSQLAGDSFEEGPAQLVLLSEHCEAISTTHALTELLGDHRVQELAVDALLDVGLRYATENALDHEQEILVAVLEHVIELGSEFAHSRLIQHEHLN